MKVRILSFETKGLRIPDWEINLDKIGNNKISIIMMPSGTGKTTTLNLLRYSFFDYSNIIQKKEIEKLYNPETKVEIGEFNVNLTINNDKYRISTKFNFKEKSISYQTTDPITGTNDGLNLPDELKKYIDQEYIEKTFFDLELVNLLFDSSEAKNSITKLYKLYYFDSINKSFDSYLSKKQSDSEVGKISKKQFAELLMKKDKLVKQRDYLIKENDEKEKKYQSLKSEKQKLTKNKNEIEQSKSNIKKQIDDARNKISFAKNNLQDAFKDFYTKLKNPILINNNIKNQLVNFEKNLNELQIPESVGKEFFDDLIKSKNCLCGHKMTDEMRKQINISKNNILSNDTWLILSVLKAKINHNSSEQVYDMNNSLSLIAQKRRELNIEERHEKEIVDEIDDKKYRDLILKINKIDQEIEELEKFFSKYNEPANINDTPDAVSIKKIQNLLKSTQKDIDEATDTKNISEKINVIKSVLSNTKNNSLKLIIENLIKKINKEIPRVMPFEKILVKDIKDKIILEGQESAAQGQLARIGYLFLITLLNRPNFNFPFIVDSPVTAMDDISRSEIAKTIAKDLDNQYCAFVLPTERADFVDVLENYSDGKLNHIVAFNTSDEDTVGLIEHAKRSGIDTTQYKHGIVAYDKKYFWEFKGNLEEADG